MKKYIFLFLFLLVNSVNAQRIISHENGITFNTGSSNVVVDGNLTVATNVSAGEKLIFGSGSYIKELYVNQPAFFDSVNQPAALFRAGGGNGGVNVASTDGFNFYSGTLNGSTIETRILRDAANTLALRNAANPQEFRFYSTYTDASNFERGSLQADAGVVTLAAESSGTGSADMDLAFKVNGNGAIYAESASGVAGNARGINAVDLQVYRTAATQAASGANSFAANGKNTASGSYSIAMMADAIASANYSVAIGNTVTASQLYSWASGLYASAYLYGQNAFASGRFSATGDAQGSRLVMRNTTSGTTPAELYLDGSSARAVLPANTSWGFTVNVVGRTTDGGSGAEQSGYYEIKGLIRRDGANNTVLVGYTTKTTIAEDDATWDVTASADDTNEALNITCTGGSGDTVRWVATINLTEVGG